MHTHFDIYRKRTLVTFAAAAQFLASPLAAQMGLGLTPMRLEFPAEGSRQYSGSLTLSNSSSEKTRVRAELLDFYVDQNSTPQFVPNVAAEAEYSCRTWLSVNPMELDMEPQTQVMVRYTARVPAQAKERSYSCAIGFVSMPTAKEAAGIGVRTAIRVVTVLYPIVGKPTVTGEIKDLALEPVSSGSEMLWRGVVVMENSGLMLYRPSGELEIVSLDGKVIETQKLISFPALPKRQQRYLLPFKSALAPGRYTLRARIDIGSEIQEASVEVTAEAPKR